MMIKSACFKSTVFIALSFVVQASGATPLEPVIDFPDYTITPPAGPEVFIAVETTKHYSLKIDAEKSYFKLEGNSYVFNGSSVEPMEYSISGGGELFVRYDEDQFHILNQTRLTSLNVDSEFNNIDLSSAGFWDENYMLQYDYVQKTPDNSICSCSTMIDINAPYMNGEFDELGLELNGGGFFKQDEIDGVFRLEQAFGLATHKISYHIEASVVSAVPVPAAIYFFFTGVAGLVLTRNRYSI